VHAGRICWDVPHRPAGGHRGDPHREHRRRTDGLDANGQLNAGLLFVSYQNDPQNFLRLQNRLGAHDLLNEQIRHIGSAIFAVPPAPKEGHYIGQVLFS
jgi:deferrochelatase/peroxidase EfeB